MRQSVRVIVFNGDDEFSASVRSDLLSIDGVQIVAEVDEITMIEQAVKQFAAEVLLVHLDPLPDQTLPVAAGIASTHERLAVMVISESTDGRHILTALRAGIREFLTKPVDSELLEAALEKVMAQTESGIEIGRLIAVMGTIGGAGASMLAANLAVELGEFAQRRPVAVVDLDFRYGQLGTMLDLQADYTIADLCDTPEQLDPAVIEKVMIKHDTGVHLLARPNQFNQADQFTAAHCASVLSALQQMYEYVVVDGPIRFDPGGLAVLDQADMSLLVIQLLVPSVRNVSRMVDELRDGGYNLDRFRLICNRVGRESAHLEIGHVETTLNRKVFHQIPDDWKTVGSAVNMGVPLREIGARTRVRAAIRELAQRIAETRGAAVEANATKGTLFGKIFSGTS